mmetsp:Transcript_21402/g.63871  ORF Transcript_21402/g.63871 Transcript_21402/m.63871 type:complete len:155 (+) Transcript_21402:142-606(+)
MHALRRLTDRAMSAQAVGPCQPPIPQCPQKVCMSMGGPMFMADISWGVGSCECSTGGCTWVRSAEWYIRSGEGVSVIQAPRFGVLIAEDGGLGPPKIRRGRGGVRGLAGLSQAPKSFLGGVGQRGTVSLPMLRSTSGCAGAVTAPQEASSIPYC